MAGLETVVAAIGTSKYAFRATRGLYDGEIATVTGIKVAADTEADVPKYAVKELLQKGILRRVTAIYKSGTQRRTLKLLVASDKLKDALDGLKAKRFSITGGTSGVIRSCGFTTRVVSRG